MCQKLPKNSFFCTFVQFWWGEFQSSQRIENLLVFHEIEVKDTSYTVFKICRCNFCKNQHLLYFINFSDFFQFWAFFWLYEGTFQAFEIVENRQTAKKISKIKTFFMEIIFNTLNNGLSSKAIPLFAIKVVLLQVLRSNTKIS